MNERKVKGEPVVYVPVGESFVALDGKTYNVVPDGKTRSIPCVHCDFKVGMMLCGRYRCSHSDRADGVGVHFVRVEE